MGTLIYICGVIFLGYSALCILAGFIDGFKDK